MASDESEYEEPLWGGNVSHDVVKVGRTVRRPATLATPAVDDFLQHLERNGFVNAPRYLGIDGGGRQMLSWVPGQLQHELGPMDLGQLDRVGRITRQLHDISESFHEPEDAH